MEQVTISTQRLQVYSFYECRKMDRNTKFNLLTNFQINLNFLCYYFSFSKEDGGAAPCTSFPQTNLILELSFHICIPFQFFFFFFLVFIHFPLKKEGNGIYSQRELVLISNKIKKKARERILLKRISHKRMTSKRDFKTTFWTFCD